MTTHLADLTAALAGKYQIERELGHGGMATVYLALDLKHRRKVAVKVLRAELAASLGPERFVREVTIAANFQHPHILALYDSGEASGFLYYVMPYVEGESLRQKLVREGELPITEAVRILRDLADALAHAHKRGVVHRDIKPENVMLSERHALVADFGVAKAVSDATGRQSLTTAGVALGTPAYMAPEQAVADPHTDHRADIYAFGVVAYELLTGRPPFTGASPQALLAAHVTTAVEPVTKYRTSIPPALAALVMKCLEKKAADRPQGMAELIPVLETALTPSGGMTPTPTQPAATGNGRKRLLWLGLGVLVVAGVAFALRKTTDKGQPAAASAATTLKSIAVLPLVNVGGDSTQDYYADGVSEELANALGKVPGLQVAARTSSFAFKGRTNLDVSEVGEQLNVGVVLQGSVRRLGDRVTLSVQLTDTRRRVELWSESYDQEVKHLFAIQDSITHTIVRQLALALGTAGRAGRAPDPEAHDLYLRGLALSNRGAGEGDFRAALSYYRRALERDPDYVAAWLGVAYLYYWLADAYQPARAAYDSMRTAAGEALKRDSMMGEAYGYLAITAQALDWNFDEGDRLFRRAIALSPNSGVAHLQYGAHSCLVGRIDQGLAALGRSVELDPLSFLPRWTRWTCLYLGRQYHAAITEKDADPILAVSLYFDDWAAAAMRELGRYPEALQRYEKAQAFSEQPLHGYAITYARMGKTKEAREILARLTTYSRGHFVNPIFFAYIYASLGEIDKAFESLDRAEADGTAWYITLRASPELEPIRSDPRYAALVKRTGLPEVTLR